MDDLERERERVAAEERELVLDTFSSDEALELGLLLLEKVRARKLPVVVDIERCGQRVFHVAAPGSAPDNACWVERKKNLVKRVWKSSYAVGLTLRAEGKTLAQKMEVSTEEFAAHGGCFPLLVRGLGFVGTVAVSGLPQKEDHDLLVETLREHLARARAH